MVQRSFKEIQWNSEFENLAVDLTYKWKETATCLNLILDQFHDSILDEPFYTAITGVPFFKVIIHIKQNCYQQCNHFLKIKL